MNHADVQRQMADYLEGDLALDRRALFDAHLDECGECAAEVTEMQDTISLLRSLPDVEVPFAFSSQVMRRIRSGEGDRSFADVLRDGLEALFSPKVMYPVSFAMLTVGVLLATGTIQLADPTVPAGTSGGSNLVLNLPGVMGPTPAERQRLVGARAADPGDGSRTLAAGGGREIVRVVPIEELMVTQQQTQPPWARTSGSNAPPGAVPVTTLPSIAGLDPGSSGGMPRPLIGSERDLPTPEEWLAELRRNPTRFSARLARLSLAEQELWVESLARHAAEQGTLAAVISALRRSPTADARHFADDFDAAGQLLRQTARDASSGAD